jgi:hypothetical protein
MSGHRKSGGGGLTTYTEGGSSIVLGNAKIIRKQFYKAEAALNAYDSVCLAREKSTSLRERLQKHACSLSEYLSWFSNGPELASRIVKYELDYADAGTSDTVYYVLREDEVDQWVEARDPPTRRTARSEPEGKVAYLKIRFGERPLKDIIKLFPEPKQVGHPKTWYQIRLFTLRFLVQHVAQCESISIRAACKRIEEMGGIFEYVNDDGKAWSKVASTREQIRHLYYEGEKAFDEFERTIRSEFVSVSLSS